MLKLEDMKNLGVFKRKILRRIYGQVWDGEMWRIRKNSELRDVYGEVDTIGAVKVQRLRCSGHMVILRKMPKNSIGKEVGGSKDVREGDGVKMWKEIIGRCEW